MNFKEHYLTENETLKDFGLKRVSNRNLRISTVYRTEQADPSYKGKYLFGKGLYTSLSKEEAEEMTLDPHATRMVKYNPEEHGKIDSYSVLYTMPLVVFDLETNEDLDKFNNLIRTVKKENLHNFFIDRGVAGLVIYGDLNYGGNQLVAYDTKYLRKN